MDRGTELLLGCIRMEDDQAKMDRLAVYTEEDWKTVLEAARKNSLSPYLYHTLKSRFDQLKRVKSIREQLLHTYLASAARNMRHYHQLLDLVIKMSVENIPVILLKGSHLAELVYGNLALRPMSDMDLLIKPDNLQQADRLLRHEGYSSSELFQGHSFEHLAPYRKSNSVTIEIHHNITEPPFSKRFAIEELWVRALEENIENTKVLTLSPEDLLLHLSSHVSIHHGFSFGITPYLDIAKSIDFYSDQLDWTILRERSETWGMQRALYLVLALSEKLIGMPVPSEFFEFMWKDKEAENALSSAEEIIFGSKRGAPQFFARLFGPEPFREKVKLIKKRLFPAKEFLFIPDVSQGNEKSGLFIYMKRYYIRLKGLYSRHAGSFWSVLRRDPAILEAMNNENKKNRLRKWLGQE